MAYLQFDYNDSPEFENFGDFEEIAKSTDTLIEILREYDKLEKELSKFKG